MGTVLVDESGQTITQIMESVRKVTSLVAEIAAASAEQATGQRQSRYVVALYDLNSEFDSIESASLFVNPSHGIGPDVTQSGENGPSIFPVTSLAARVLAKNFRASAMSSASRG